MLIENIFEFNIWQQNEKDMNIDDPHKTFLISLPMVVAAQHEFVYDPASQPPLAVCIYRPVILTGLTSRNNVKQQANTLCWYVIATLVDFLVHFTASGMESLESDVIYVCQ